MKKHPKRFAGLAALPTMVPDKAAAELERCVRELGFRGALINGHVRGRYMDDKFFWRLSSAPKRSMCRSTCIRRGRRRRWSRRNIPASRRKWSWVFATSGWGWHIETAIHVIRLILGGVFDRYPKLQIVVGHLSEGLSFMLPRLDRNLQPPLTKLQRTLGDYLRQNVHYTFGGFNFPATFLDLLLEVGAERIMFSVDHPYGSMAQAARLPGANPGQRRGQGAHRARQCGEAL